MQLMQLRLLAGVLLILTIPITTMWDPGYEQADSLNTKNIKQVLEKQIFGMSINKKALDAFLEQNFAAFDPAVGDNLCQVRAHAIIALSLRSLSANKEIIAVGDVISKTSDQLQLIANKVSSMLAVRASQNVLEEELKKSTLSAFLLKRGCVIPVFADDIRGLMLNYFITRFCHFNQQRGQELLNELMKQSCLSKNAAKNLINWARVELNAYSLRYLQRVSDQLLNNSSAGDKINELTNEFARAQVLKQGLAQQVKSQLWTTPSVFIGMVVLLKDILLNNMPVALFVQTICLQGMHNDVVTYPVHEQAAQKMRDPVFVVKGISDPAKILEANLEFDALEKKVQNLALHDDSQCDQRKVALKAIRNLNFNDIILANCAMHRQFLDPQATIDFSSIKELEPEYEMFKAKAPELGLCKENMRCFRILHIFPAKLNEITK